MAVGAKDRIDKLLVKKYAKEQVDNHDLIANSMVNPGKDDGSNERLRISSQKYDAYVKQNYRYLRRAKSKSKIQSALTSKSIIN